MTAKWSLDMQDGLRTQTFLDLTLKNKIGVRYTLYRKDKHKQYEMMRADIVCARHGQNHDIWNFARFGFRFEVSSSVTATERTAHDKYFVTPNSDIIRDGVYEVLTAWQQEIGEKLHSKHVPAQPEWLDVDASFVGILIVGDERSQLPPSSSHWLLYHGLVMAKILEYRQRVLAAEDEKNEWLDDILWTMHERFGAFVAQNRNETAQRVFAG